MEGQRGRNQLAGKLGTLGRRWPGNSALKEQEGREMESPGRGNGVAKVLQVGQRVFRKMQGACGRGRWVQNWNLSKERDAPNPQFLPDCENSLAGCDPAAAGGWVSRVVR